MSEKKKLYISFGFKNGKLVTIVHSLCAEIKDATNCGYFTTNNQDAEKQITEWKKRFG